MAEPRWSVEAAGGEHVKSDLREGNANPVLSLCAGHNEYCVTFHLLRGAFHSVLFQQMGWQEVEGFLFTAPPSIQVVTWNILVVNVGSFGT